LGTEVQWCARRGHQGRLARGGAYQRTLSDRGGAAGQSSAIRHPGLAGERLDDQDRWLRLDRPTDESGEPYPPGYCHFPKYSDEYFKQITAEQLVTRVVKGYRRPEWQKTRDRNDALDARCYARAAAAVYGMDRFNEMVWKTLEERLAAASRQLGQPPQPPQPARPPQRKRSATDSPSIVAAAGSGGEPRLRKLQPFG